MLEDARLPSITDERTIIDEEMEFGISQLPMLPSRCCLILSRRSSSTAFSSFSMIEACSRTSSSSPVTFSLSSMFPLSSSIFGLSLSRLSTVRPALIGLKLVGGGGLFGVVEPEAFEPWVASVCRRFWRRDDFDVRGGAGVLALCLIFCRSSSGKAFCGD